MGDGVTSSLNAPASQAGRGATSRSADSAAEAKFAQAKQSAVAESPTSMEQLTNLCLPWDNDEAGLLKNIAPPRECRIPHPVISPEAMYDGDTNAKPLELPGQTIEVHDKAPPESPLASAVRNKIAEIPTQDQFEKNLLWKANHFAKNWSMERWHDYIQGPPPEGFNDAQKFEWQKAATNWQSYVTQAYNQAWDKAEAKLLDNYRRIDVANSVVKSNLKFQLAGTFFAVVPAAGAIYGGWSAGVSGGEALTGHNSGMQVADLVSGNWNDHRKLSPPEIIGRVAEVGLGALTIAAGYLGGRSGGETAPRSGSNTGVVSGQIVSRELAGATPHAPAEPKVIVSNKAYEVGSSQAAKMRAIGVDPAKAKVVANASDGHGADFEVIASPARRGDGAAGTGDSSGSPRTTTPPATRSRDPRLEIRHSGPEKVQATVSPSSSNSPTATANPEYKVSTNPNNVDWRGSGRTVDDAVREAFKQTGVPIEAFRETKWVKTEYGKTVPVEWTGPRGAQVAIDVQHQLPSPDIPHVNWQGPGKGAPDGHIFLDHTPYGRPIDPKP
jgi:putative RNase toxin 47 of polymorphic toxin system